MLFPSREFESFKGRSQFFRKLMLSFRVARDKIEDKGYKETKSRLNAKLLDSTLTSLAATVRALSNDSIRCCKWKESRART